LSKNLKAKTINSLKWSTIEKFSSSIVQFSLGILIARLLTPADYGLIGMLTIFIALSQAIIDGGFSTALIQKKEVSSREYSSVFFLNIILGIFFYILIFFSAPFIAAFYNQDELINITKVLGLNFIISSFSIIHLTYLTKNLDFKLQSKISIITSLISGLLALYFAYNGWGVWALVFQSILKNILNTLFLWLLVQWKPSMIYSWISIKSLFPFGSRVMGSSILNTLFDNLYYIIIGKFFSTKELGFYTQAHKIQQFPVSFLTGIIQRVFLPSFSQIQDENQRLISIYRKTIKLTAFIVFPIMLGLGAVAKPLILILLTEKWSAVIPMLQLMVIYGMFYPIHALNLNLLNVKGRSDLFFRLEVFKKILIVIMLLITFQISIFAMIIGNIVVSFIAFFINTYYTEQLIRYNYWQQIKDFSLSLGLALVMAIICYVITLHTTNHYFSIFIAALTGLIFYLGTAYYLKMPEYLEIKAIINKKNKL
jgi:teichuronic acid exporter